MKACVIYFNAPENYVYGCGHIYIAVTNENGKIRNLSFGIIKYCIHPCSASYCCRLAVFIVRRSFKTFNGLNIVVSRTHDCRAVSVLLGFILRSQFNNREDIRKLFPVFAKRQDKAVVAESRILGDGKGIINASAFSVLDLLSYNIRGKNNGSTSDLILTIGIVKQRCIRNKIVSGATHIAVHPSRYIGNRSCYPNGFAPGILWSFDRI